MAKKRKTSKAAAKSVTAAQKGKFMKQLAGAEGGLKTLTATVKALRAHAAALTYVGGAPMAKRARRRKRG